MFNEDDQVKYPVYNSEVELEVSGEVSGEVYDGVWDKVDRRVRGPVYEETEERVNNYE